jgi:predicted cupin superfamily sugar epimerase
MKTTARAFPTCLVLAALIAASSFATAQTSGDVRPTEIIRQLKLSVLPKESGYLGLIGSSALTTDVGGKKIAVQSQVYYMLTRERPINYLHWLAGDDTHILIEGGPVDYFIFHPDGRTEKVTLGRNYSAGERALIAVPGGCWKALRLHDGASYALMANVLSPEFTPDRVKIGAGEDWISKYTSTSPWATRETLRAFIGPNWTDK